jgi:hypothetical protein
MQLGPTAIHEITPNNTNARLLENLFHGLVCEQLHVSFPVRGR